MKMPACFHSLAAALLVVPAFASSVRTQTLASPDAVPGHRYNIERAPAITDPWSTLATPTAPLDGLIEYVNTNSPTAAAFYRTSAP